MRRQILPWQVFNAAFHCSVDAAQAIARSFSHMQKRACESEDGLLAPQPDHKEQPEMFRYIIIILVLKLTY